MNKTNIKIVSVFCLLLVGFLISCGNNSNPISKAEWLIGTWVFEDDFGNVSYETWKKISKNELQGKSYVLSKGDTVVFEILNMIQQDDNLYYTALVPEHNNDSTISFPLKSITEDEMLFENLQHDFPQKISYRKISNDSLIAKISGIMDGEENFFDIPMRRK
ncbi:DUF6265 family protein [Bacteroidales bacterium OttesenSCG-928-K03]|nr:DUF6265 family protein [Bacteroidales bacterium OttesenSCG-928-L14]MDL2243046.1 DUF6265 family protein [Bacteroidales bacterium OttesenSCG-928-K03]